ncbi:hypothetical protein [Streptomyces sp. TE33382]
MTTGTLAALLLRYRRRPHPADLSGPRLPPWREHDDHPHLCPVCHGDDHQPQHFAAENMRDLDQLLADAIKDKTPTHSPLGS